MYGRWIKGYFILALLLFSSVSLSMAACPWFIKNDLYAAECGVLKEVPASSGILANDPISTAVVDPESITIDPKYGTLVVNADGSFVYDPSPDIQSGTYVIFKYMATNGVCEAKYPGTAKIQVTCKCRPNVVDITICEPITREEIIALIEDEADCWGCGDIAPIFDFSGIPAGDVPPGEYSYLMKCPGCSQVVGFVIVMAGCEAVASDIEVCEDEVDLAELTEMIKEVAYCDGEGCGAPTIDLTGVTVDENGFVTGGSYTATCAEGTECESKDTGTITVIQMCDVAAPDIVVCEGEVDLDELTAMILDKASCSEGCDMDVDTSGVTVENGFVTGGSYRICCTVTGPMGTECTSCDSGDIIVIEKCDVEALDFPVECNTLEDLYEIGFPAFCSGSSQGCDLAPEIDDTTIEVMEEAPYYVTGGYYTATCTAVGPDGTECKSSDTGNMVVTPCIEPCPCVAVAPLIEVCEGEVTLAELQGMIDAVADCQDDDSGVPCDATPAIDTSDVTVSNGFVTGGTYTVTCKSEYSCDPVTATGIVTAVPCCECVAYAPDLSLKEKTCGGYNKEEIKEAVIAAHGSCSEGCEMTIWHNVGNWHLEKCWDYSVTCTKPGCADAVDYGILCLDSDGICC